VVKPGLAVEYLQWSTFNDRQHSDDHRYAEYREAAWIEIESKGYRAIARLQAEWLVAD